MSMCRIPLSGFISQYRPVGPALSVTWFTETYNAKDGLVVVTGFGVAVHCISVLSCICFMLVKPHKKPQEAKNVQFIKKMLIVQPRKVPLTAILV